MVIRSYRAYYHDWLDDKWAYVNEWLTHLPELILWYSVAGAGSANQLKTSLLPPPLP